MKEYVAYVQDKLYEAASIEKMLTDKERRFFAVKSGWPDYLYDADDRQDQEPEFRKSRPTAKQIDLYEKVLLWLRIIGLRQDKRTIMGKKIIWARANGFSYRDIAFQAGIPPTTCEYWYKQDLNRIARRIFA